MHLIHFKSFFLQSQAFVNQGINNDCSKLSNEVTIPFYVKKKKAVTELEKIDTKETRIERKHKLDGDTKNSLKNETKLRAFKFVNKQDRLFMRKFIENSPVKIHPSQLCPSVALESLSPELKKLVRKSSKLKEMATSQTSSRSRFSRKNLSDDFNTTCSEKRKVTETRTKLSLRRRKQEESITRIEPVEATIKEERLEEIKPRRVKL